MRVGVRHFAQCDAQRTARICPDERTSHSASIGSWGSCCGQGRVTTVGGWD